jgi:hypothetical protein
MVTTPVEEWIAEAQALQRKMIAEHGLLTGSTDDIAEDRQRDV